MPALRRPRRLLRLTYENSSVRRQELRQAAATLRALLLKVEWGALTASKRVTARLEGAVVALEEAGSRRSRRKR